jgi:hypothetical protein
MEFSGVTNPTPLKKNLVPRFGGIGKQEEIQDILDR